MADQFIDQTAITKTVLSLVGRSTLPVRQARSGDPRGTAFWFDDLVAAAPGGALVRQYLMTAAGTTRFDLGELVLRPALCDPPVNPDVLLMPGFAGQWALLDRLGVAVMPTGDLHAHAGRRGWRWTTDPVDDGLAATAQDTAALGGHPVPAHAVGHPGTAGAPVVVTGRIHRCNDNTVRWTGDTSDGLAGAPVLTARPGGEGPADLMCAGILLPDGDHHSVVTFDRVRLALRDLAPSPPLPRPRWPHR